MPNKHKHPPIAFRPTEGDRLWLLWYAKATGKPVNKILTEAVAAYRAVRDPGDPVSCPIDAKEGKQ